jgi:hypothetical protein
MMVPVKIEITPEMIWTDDDQFFCGARCEAQDNEASKKKATLKR